MASNLVAPEIPQGGNLAAPFLSAFVAMAGVANKRRQLEDQLQKMALANQIAEQKLAIQGSTASSLISLHQAEANAANARASTVADKADKATDHANEIVEFQKAISGITAEPGTKDYMTQLNVVRSQYPRLLATPDGQRLWNDNFQTHKYTASQMVQGQKAVARDYLEQTKAEGIKPIYLENPDQWAYIGKDGKMVNDPKQAVARALPFDTDEATKSIFPVSPAVAKTKDIKIWKTLPVNRFDQLVKQHEAYKGIVDGIITGAKEPDVSAAAQSAQPTSIPRLTDPAQVAGLESGTKFYDPNGILRTAP